jgi:hypothetical protein
VNAEGENPLPLEIVVVFGIYKKLQNQFFFLLCIMKDDA